MAKLSEDQIRQALLKLTEWKLEKDMIVKEFKFRDFATSVKFLTMIQPVADSLDHHPDVCIYYNRVVIHLTTHDEVESPNWISG